MSAVSDTSFSEFHPIVYGVVVGLTVWPLDFLIPLEEERKPSNIPGGVCFAGLVLVLVERGRIVIPRCCSLFVEGVVGTQKIAHSISGPPLRSLGLRLRSFHTLALALALCALALFCLYSKSNNRL